jgi:hypothetical protein
MLWLASSPISSWRSPSSRVLQTDRSQSIVSLDGFITREGGLDAFDSGSCTSRRVGFRGPTMVLSETQGLQLYLVMRGGIW